MLGFFYHRHLVVVINATDEQAGQARADQIATDKYREMGIQEQPTLTGVATLPEGGTIVAWDNDPWREDGKPVIGVKGAGICGHGKIAFTVDTNFGGIISPDGTARLLPCESCGVCYWLPVNTVAMTCDDCANREATEARLTEHFVRRYAQDTGRPESDYRGKLWVSWDSEAKVYDVRGQSLPAHPDCADLYPNGWGLLDHIYPETAITYR